MFSARHVIPELFVLVNPLRGTAIEVGVALVFEDAASAASDEVIQRLVADWSDPQLFG